MGTRGSPHGNAQLVPRTDALDPRAQEGRHSRAGLSAAAVDLGRYVPQGSHKSSIAPQISVRMRERE